MGTRDIQFTGRHSASGRVAQVPLSRKPPVARGGECVPTAPRANLSTPFPLPWIRENAELLHRLFTRVEERRKQGFSLSKALRRRWHGKRFHTAHRVKVRHGQDSLRVLYYHWRKSGMTPECVAVRYPSTIPPVSAEILRAFVAACGVAGVQHFSQAVKLIDAQGVSYRRMLAALPDQVCRVIRETFLARRLAKVEARKLERQSIRQKHRALAADAARSRKLERLAAESFIGRRVGGGVESSSSQAKAPIQVIQRAMQCVCKGVAGKESKHGS